MSPSHVPASEIAAEKDILRKATVIYVKPDAEFKGTWMGEPVYGPAKDYIAFTFLESGGRAPAVQRLFDDLWRLGVRPSSQEPATAVHRHLEDMRRIAFKALNLPKPEDD